MGIFSKDNMQKLLHNKFIILIGDSGKYMIFEFDAITVTLARAD